MKRIIPLVFLVAILASCGSTKNYLERSDQDKALQDAVKRLNKNASDENALKAIPILYADIQQNHLAKIKSYRTGKDLTRWDKIINEYEGLQNAYTAVINSTPAFKLVNAQNFSTNILEAKQEGADQYYQLAQTFLDNGGRDNAKKAYTYFKKSDKYIPGFKDAKVKMDQAFENAVVNVIINPVEDNSFFFNSGWGNTGYNYSNEYFQQTLIRDLQNTGSANRYAARFYTDWEARRENIHPDWVVDLRLRDMDIPYPVNYTYRRNASARIQAGSDTSGHPIYQTVYATINITRMSFTARANMEVSINDIATGRNISFRNFREDYRWQQEAGNYSGDSRALNANDWSIINNNNNYNTPRKEDILGELYRKIYPQVKNNISYAVDW
ncbi:MAG: hypothetical protein ABIT07_10320 [Ferruginibacter sp.]